MRARQGIIRRMDLHKIALNAFSSEKTEVKTSAFSVEMADQVTIHGGLMQTDVCSSV